jgi:hypothetical protein
VDNGRLVRGGAAREQPQEVLELRREVKDAAPLGEEEGSGAELVDGEEPAASALVPEGEGERPAQPAESPVAVARVRRGEGARVDVAARHRAAHGAVVDRAVDAQPARLAGRERSLEAG